MKKNLISLLPFAIAILLVVIHIIQVYSSPAYIDENGASVSYSMTDTVLYMFIGLIITFIFIVLKQPYWKYVFLGLTLIGLTSVFQFYNHTLFIGIGPLRIELTALSLLIVHLIVNPDIVTTIKLKFKPSEQSLQNSVRVNEEKYESRVRRFEKKFESKSLVELKQLINDHQLIPEAIEAAKRLVDKAES